jgi:hypothetical protein
MMRSPGRWRQSAAGKAALTLNRRSLYSLAIAGALRGCFIQCALALAQIVEVSQLGLASLISPSRIRQSFAARAERRRVASDLLKDPEFARRCLEERDELKAYFSLKLDLNRAVFEHGTLMFDVERRLLRDLVERSNDIPGPIIEIGTLFGETTTRIALWKSPHKKIVTVDNYSWNPWRIGPAAHEALTERVLRYLRETGQVEIHSCDKDKFYREYRGEKPSLVFLDADHGYEATKADIEWARKVGAAIISGHDYGDHCPGVGRAVEEAGGAACHAGGVWALRSPYLNEAVQHRAA